MTSVDKNIYVLCSPTPALGYFFLHKIERRDTPLYKMDMPIRIRVS